MRRLLTILATIATTVAVFSQLPAIHASGGFTLGNIVVYRVGDGAAGLGSAATAVFLDEYTSAGTLVQSIAMPTAVSGANKRLTASGSSTTEGFLTRSADGQYLIVPGYDAAPGTASIATSAAATTNRVIGRVDSNGSVDTTTGTTAITGGNPRGVASSDGTRFWIVGSLVGVQTVSFGNSAPTTVSTTQTNLRQVHVFGGQLYTTTAAGTAFRVGAVGSGLPTTSGQTTTPLPGLPTSGGGSNGIFFADLSAAVAGLDTLYIADDSVSQLQKYSLAGGVWTSNGNITVTSARGLTGAVDGTTVTLYGSSGATGQTLYKFVDNAGYNVAIAGATTTIASAAANTAFRGVALTPSNSQASPPTNPTGVGSASPSPVEAGASTLLTVTVTPGASPTSTGVAVVANLSSIGGSATQAFAGSGNTFTFTATVSAATTASVKSLPVTITDAESRTGSATIALTVTTPVPTDEAPAITGVTPQDGATGVSTGTNVTVTFSEPVTATNAFSLTCGSASQAFAVSVVANTLTLDPTADLPYGTSCTVVVTAANVSDVDTIDPPDHPAGDVSWTFTTENPPPQTATPVVISQIYGGGGNLGAVYQNDFVELYNRSAATVSITGWSLQYSSATGSSWGSGTGITNLYGTFEPGQYYLIALASGGAVGAPLPAANISGPTNISATAGKLALVSNLSPLTGTCPVTPGIVDFVGYGGTANCKEGATAAPAPSNSTALFRKQGGAWDTDDNGRDFVTGSPSPRQTAPIVTIEVGPTVTGTDPAFGALTAPHDATMEVDFSEPVDVDAGWFSIACGLSGLHDSVTTAMNGKNHYITPNVGFLPNEQCTVTIHKDQVHDVDDDDILPGTDTLPADYVWSFTVAGEEHPPYPPDVHLTMGNPSGAVADVSQWNNYLMSKPEFALSYNRDSGRPNWVSWHLTPEWYGTLARLDTFRPDPAVPPDWYRVQSFDFQLSGFDRGHMVPNADRDGEIPINQATFLMSNMVAQAPDNNQGPWANLENYLRSVADAGNELYVIAGPAGTGGTGSNGFTTTLAGGHVTVPAYTWKVALVLPRANGDDVARVTCATGTIAVIMPNTQGIRTNDWHAYLTTVDAVESLTGFDLFSNVPQTIQNCIQAGVNGNNPQSQVIVFPPIGTHHFGDPDFAANAVASSGLPVSLTVVSGGPATIVNGLIHLTGPGTVTIRATQSGNALYAKAVPVEQTFTADKAIQTLTFDALPDRSYGEAPFTVSASGGASGDAVTFAATGACTSTGTDGSTIVITAAGSCSVTASLAGDANYDAAADVTQSFAVAPAALSVSANDVTREFGTPNPAFTGPLTGVVAGDGITVSYVTVAGLASPVGNYPIVPELNDPNSRLENYVVSSHDGLLTVVDTKPPVINAVTPNVTSIWPPNKSMVQVSIAVGVVDVADRAPVCRASPATSRRRAIRRSPDRWRSVCAPIETATVTAACTPLASAASTRRATRPPRRPR
jgi:DNA/RNA endonuclease G (NUC1)